MIKEHPQKDNMIIAAHDESARFVCAEWGIEYQSRIEDVLEFENYNWKLYTPPKPDIVDYGVEYFSSKATYWTYAPPLYNGDKNIRIVKRTINGETGNITIEVIS